MARRNQSGRYVSKKALGEQFDPCTPQRETYLLCKLRWGNRGLHWKQWVRNGNDWVRNRNDDDSNSHAEVYFLEKIFEPRSSKLCYITWYLSWSPCATCCYRIWNFLKSHPNVNLDIRVARLYETYRAETCKGLRELAHLRDGVTIRVMETKDYNYCWKTFIRKGVDWDFSDFEPVINRNRWRLNNILEDEKVNNIMKEKLRVQFFSFGFQREKLVDFYLELCTHLRNPPPDSFFNLDLSIGFSSPNGATQPLSAVF